MFKKKFVHITVAISCLGLIIFLHSQITGILIAVMADAAQTGSGRLATEMHYRYHNVVTTGLAGIALFALLRALELHLSQKDINAHKIVKYKQTALVMLRWAVVLVSGDIVMQNLMGINSSIFDYSMRYQIVGALLAIELLILSRFFYSRKNKQSTEQL